MSSFNFVDIIILVIFFCSVLVGFGRGLVSEVISLGTLIAAFVVAILFTSTLSGVLVNSSIVQSLISQTTNASGVNTAQPVTYISLGLSFAILFAGTVIAGTILRSVLDIAFQTGILGIGNRILGAGFGLVRGFIINLVLIFLIQLSPLSQESWWQQSSLVGAFQPAVAWLGSFVSPALSGLKDEFGQTIDNVNTSIKNLGIGGS